MDVYLQWFKFYSRPVLLIEDGHGSHIWLDVIKMARENDVHVLCLPSHCTRLLQPLDTFLFHFSSQYSKYIEKKSERERNRKREGD